MKALLTIGVVLFLGGLVYGATNTNMHGLPNGNTVYVANPNKVKIVSGSILTGLALMIISGIMYLRS